MDKDSMLAQIIYNTLGELDESKRLAYRKELGARNNVWRGIHQAISDFDDGATSFRDTVNTIEMLQEIENESGNNIRSRLLLESSRIHRYLGKIDAANTKLTQALELARKDSDENLLAEILKERGDFYRRSNQDDLNLALKDYKDVIDIYHKQKDKTGKANAQVRIASVFVTAGQPRDGLQACEESLKYAVIIGDKYLERKSLEYKAWAYSMLGDFDKALTLQLEAHEITKKTSGQRKELAKSFSYLAGFYLMCGLFDKAEKYFIEADRNIEDMIRSRNESGDEKEIFIRGLIYLGIGTLKSQNPNTRIDARNYFIKSLALAEQSNDSLIIGRALKRLAHDQDK